MPWAGDCAFGGAFGSDSPVAISGWLVADEACLVGVCCKLATERTLPEAEVACVAASCRRLKIKTENRLVAIQALHEPDDVNLDYVTQSSSSPRLKLLPATLCLFPGNTFRVTLCMEHQ